MILSGSSYQNRDTRSSS